MNRYLAITALALAAIASAGCAHPTKHARKPAADEKNYLRGVKAHELFVALNSFAPTKSYSKMKGIMIGPIVCDASRGSKTTTCQTFESSDPGSVVVIEGQKASVIIRSIAGVAKVSSSEGGTEYMIHQISCFEGASSEASCSLFVD